MTTILPVMTDIDGFTVTGLRVRTQNTDEFNEKTAKLPGLWQQFYSSDLVTKATVFGVYSDYESDANGLYTVTAGIICDNDRAKFSSVAIQAGTYLVFQGVGPMPLAVIEAWKQVWSYFATESPYQRNFVSDYEEYNGSDKVTIYIGIK